MIKVTIWNEFWHETVNDKVKAIYPEGIHMHLKNMLACDDFLIRTAYLEQDEEHGLSEELLNDTDVLIWWGHCKHESVKITNENLLYGSGNTAELRDDLSGKETPKEGGVYLYRKLIDFAVQQKPTPACKATIRQ